MAIFVIQLYGDATVQVKAGELVSTGNGKVLADGVEVDFGEAVVRVERFEQE